MTQVEVRGCRGEWADLRLELLTYVAWALASASAGPFCAARYSTTARSYRRRCNSIRRFAGREVRRCALQGRSPAIILGSCSRLRDQEEGLCGRNIGITTCLSGGGQEYPQHKFPGWVLCAVSSVLSAQTPRLPGNLVVFRTKQYMHVIGASSFCRVQSVSRPCDPRLTMFCFGASSSVLVGGSGRASYSAVHLTWVPVHWSWDRSQ